MAHDHDTGAGYAYGEGEYGHTPAGAGHEHTDAHPWTIVKFGLWLAVSAIIVHIGVFFIFGLFVEQREETDHQFPLAVGQERRLPSGARLQPIPVNDIYQFRLQEQRVLDNYGWIDRNGGRVQIPITEAMRLVVEREAANAAPAPQPAPDAPQAEAARAGGADAAAPTRTMLGMMPSDASSGRTLERRRQ
jgi:hypothetical protein